MTDATQHNDTDDAECGPFYCPFCEAVVVIGGEPVTDEDEAYWHACDHEDKGPHAMSVLETFVRLDTTTTDQHKPGGARA